jgi:hypothetical protein
MTLTLSMAARNVQADALAVLADSGSAAGRIRVYTGSRPASPDSTATGTLLCEFVLADPAFGSAGSGAITLDVSSPITTAGVADGTAGWWRMLTSTQASTTGLGIIDGIVTVTGGGGDMTTSTITVTSGGSVQLTSLVITIPAS